MIPLNSNLTALKRSQIRTFTNLARQTPDCASLTIGEPDFDTPEAIKAAAVAALQQGQTHYAPNQGTQKLRAAIADYETHRGNPVTEDRVLVTIGACQALFTAFLGILNPGEEVIVPVNLVAGIDENYNALQFEIKVPDGVFINDIVSGSELADVELSFMELGTNTYRVVAYTKDNSPFAGDDAVVADISLQTFSVIEEELRKLEITNAYAVNGANDEVRLADATVSFGETTGIDATLATAAVRGGDCITVTALAAQDVAVYSVDGRLVRKVRVGEGTTRIAVPAGMYIVGGTKVLVY